MNISIKKQKGLLRTLSLDMSVATLDQDIEQRLKRISKTIQIKGFRKGKASFEVVKQKFGEQISQEASNELLNKSYQRALEQEKIHPASKPEIIKIEHKPGKIFICDLSIEIYSETQLCDLSKLSIKQYTADINDKAVDEVVEKMRMQHAQWQDADENAPVVGDCKVNIDYQGSIKGQTFEGGTAQKQDIFIGRQMIIEDMEKGIIGMKARQQKNIQVKFSKDYHNKELAGKKAIFDVTLNTIAEPILPKLDKEFFVKFDVQATTLEKFRNLVHANLKKEIDAVIDELFRYEVLEKVAAASKIQAPQAVIKREMDLMRQSQVQASQGRIEAGDIEDKTLEKPASDRVRAGLALQAIIANYEITIKQEEVAMEIDRLATDYADSAAFKKFYKEQPRQLEQLQLQLLESKVVAMVRGKAKIKKIQKSYQQIMMREKL